MAKETHNLVPRPPVVVVMGHVDHGKTSLLDCIRKTHIASKEAGGITQHLGAYEAEVASVDGGRKITFLDTPGHEAFAKIRQRGSLVADVAVLVIAAEEGLKPQTLEALSYIQKEQLPYVIALNKIDRPEANPDKVKQQLAEQGIFVEGYGGNVPTVLTSAKTGEGIDNLLELILLVYDMNEKKADYQAPAEGVILESSMDAKRGISAAILVLQGTLHRGDTIYTPSASTKIKLMENFLGKPVPEVTFSSPAQITGWDIQPLVGEWFSTNKPEQTQPQQPDAPEQKKQDIPKNQLAIILKADVAGSLEALETVIGSAISELKIPYAVVDKSVGDIVLWDLKTAEATNAMIIGFKSRVTSEAKNYIQSRPITVITGDIIYHIAEQVTNEIKKNLAPDAAQPTARGEIIMIFSDKDNRNRQIVGVHLTEGIVEKTDWFTLVRDNAEVGKGKVLSLQKNKDGFDMIKAECECGVQIETDATVALHDIINFFNK
ncbi:MAG: translation initiation factor IF-2 [Candidatus Brennerbacteria bacterium CG11_big_fil_rev_8_21_14_0_20_43_10]|uniref:Translation initiation factor IF-2 n=3 Tax=Candidatus Brenneribacteriota TaxID=1817902 RepID=A0A2M8C0Z9_9BACT|nr:MAG: hypothetical protein AUJ43_01375 [Parcubacteria group bacterium CG1_02_44_31]PIP50663.1 MAG: translation initiation factor IF-2 [Candidatus Brennerbacteria bacterium CG23_combo_of_CG06-09_8_20_14_all_44_41]PIR26994.1 MAG: translation initiation factor IF-2 [Candidatus Brennerbacteria bacterium CG11_big_fil_rev_8_21_14_0_20_43_10]PIX28722.1 MAG: translation initiation factor IF-2 [Candidatus Brennerbacteria bacterium CG_4_8_14_3_um_filter_43_14]PJB49789.1 MAG: translation initiation fact